MTDLRSPERASRLRPVDLAADRDLGAPRPGTTKLVCQVALAAILICQCAARTPIDAPPLVTEPLPASEAQPYRLQPGDLIAVKFWNAKELDEEVRVRPDGKISLPFIDEVEAAGLTPTELDGRLSELYVRELARPNITVIVREASPPRVFIGGEVGNQGVFELADNLTMFRAIQQAGGFTTTARPKQVLLIRMDAAGQPTARAVDLRPVMSGGDPTRDVFLAANDVIFVPRTKIKSVSLFVQQYINEIIPLQNVLGGLLLADLTQDSTTSSTTPSSSESPADGNNP